MRFATYQGFNSGEQFFQYLKDSFDCLYKEGETMPLQHESLDSAKEKLLEAREEYLNYFKQNPEARTLSPVFGKLNKFEWYLLERKHLNHHFEQFNLLS